MNENNFLPPESTPRPRILVVDDDRSIRLINTEVLADHGYDVTDAADGADAWDELQRNRYDLLITDNDMPRLSGVELIRRLQDAHQTLPVIMVTGSLPDEAPDGQPELQIEAVLLKPYTISALLDTVKNVLHATGAGHANSMPSAWQHPSAGANRRLE